ncbi:amino acid permease [Bacillus sonorensis]|uniref:Amino acid transporter n=2 Tax=Bacillus sonorensis TaxID=119858 RepID=M5PGE0_9BACI|nr:MULTISPECIES: amino acid permease [Bacillus]TWK74143.1 L-methionine/branched-chain amino acid exporter YjeH [Bacillus paralicheniformis]ASB87840.1 putative amino acid permease YecA [Bacillus sonorensis]EME76690.1 amino acid transporter [Bacillus sonorensis L12]MBG9915750.1 amino acid permease [Bacillus sonorensis]MCF7617175.1 amino acid permease [Bacillus sonorensis]
MREKKLGPLLLSGLMTGPILGSGIILLPPMVHDIAGDYAIFAWLLMMGTGFLFAWIFAKLSIEYPNDAGVAYAAEKAFGPYIRNLAVFYFIMAASFGPAAVLMTAGEYIQSLAPDAPFSAEAYGLALFIICLIVLCFDISFVGKVSFVCSSAAAVVLLGGSLTSIPYFREGPLVDGSFQIGDFGRGMLLLFWALVGWEMIGNYSMEVKDRKKTITRAVILSSLMVTVIYLATAGAAQWIDPGRFESGRLKLAMMLTPLFGPFALPVIAALTSVLCLSTYLLVVGGASRLISSQARGILACRTKDNKPLAALCLIFIIHAIVFGCLFYQLINVETLVAIANAFFICNSLCGLAAAYRLLPGLVYRVVCVLLICCFALLLLFSSPWILCFMVLMTACFICRNGHAVKQGHGQL